MPEAALITTGSDSFANSTVLDPAIGITIADVDFTLLLFSIEGDNNVGGQLDHHICRGEIIDQTTIRFTRAVAHASVLPVIHWTLIEFDSSELDSAIQRGTVDLAAATDNLDSNLSPAVTVADTAVIVSSSTILVSPRPITGGFDSLTRVELTSTTQVTFLTSGTPASGESFHAWQVIEFLAGDVTVHRGLHTLAEDSTSQSVTAATFIAANTVLSFSNAAPDGTGGTPYGRAHGRGLITGNDAFTVEKASAAGADSSLLISWELLEFLDGTSVTQGDIPLDSSTATDTDTIGSVDSGNSAVWESWVYGMNSCNTVVEPEFFAGIDLTSDTVVTATRADTGTASAHAYQIIEWAVAAPAGGLPIPIADHHYRMMRA